METIQHRRLVLWIHIRDQRITGGLDRAVGETDEKGRDEQTPEPAGEDGQEQAGHMADEGDIEEILRPEVVVEQSAHHHGDGKTQEGHGIDPAELEVGQREAHAELGQDAGTDGEGHRGDDQGKAAGEKQPGGIGG